MHSMETTSKNYSVKSFSLRFEFITMSPKFPIHLKEDNVDYSPWQLI